ncbi:hypothetical protein VDG1235_264 [Verrucomicrobiia bacterium DG1235]|nr:hypothetical protein VDG1235_264 [Verrucomicrobiae bacterium DG1235]
MFYPTFYFAKMKILGASVERRLPYDKEMVRRFISAPALIVNWHPWVEKISIFEEEGLLYRKSILSGGETELVEKFWEDEDQDEFHYQVVQGLWSDCRYRSKISLESCEDGSIVSWQGRLMMSEPDDESEQMEAFYEEGLRGLEEFLADL